jgi:hypothetical protein
MYLKPDQTLMTIALAVTVLILVLILVQTMVLVGMIFILAQTPVPYGTIMNLRVLLQNLLTVQ